MKVTTPRRVALGVGWLLPVRRLLTAGSLFVVLVIARLTPIIDDPARGLMLLGAVFPLVWLLWALARASAYGHANSYARDVDKVHGRRPRPLPRQEVSR